MIFSWACAIVFVTRITFDGSLSGVGFMSSISLASKLPYLWFYRFKGAALFRLIATQWCIQSESQELWSLHTSCAKCGFVSTVLSEMQSWGSLRGSCVIFPAHICKCLRGWSFMVSTNSWIVWTIGKTVSATQITIDAKYSMCGLTKDI